MAQISRYYTELVHKLFAAFPPDLARTVIRSEKDLFLRSLPFLLAESTYALFFAIFPGSAVLFDDDFRDRLDLDLNLLLGGVKICTTTQQREKEKMFGVRAFKWNRRKGRRETHLRPKGDSDLSDSSSEDEEQEQDGSKSKRGSEFWY